MYIYTYIHIYIYTHIHIYIYIYKANYFQRVKACLAGEAKAAGARAEGDK